MRQTVRTPSPRRMIGLTGFTSEPPDLLREQLVAVERVMRSGWYILGPEVKSFEREWSEYLGIPYSIGVGNGMDAIEIGLRALDIGPGDEVITTPVTAFASVLAVLRAGASPVLADIDPRSGILDPESVKRCLSGRTKAIMPVHLYGHVTRMDAWRDLADSASCLLIEDSAQAHGARWEGKSAGAFGAYAAYSFYPTKNLGALGDGGALVTGSELLSNRAMVMRNYGQTVRYHHVETGLNSRLDEMQAAILSVRLKWLDSFTAARRRLASKYRAGISNPKVTLLDAPIAEENHVYHLFVVKSAERDRLAAHLQARGIEALIHYPVPVHRQPPCTGLARDPNGLTAAERFSDECLSIPCHPHLSDEEVDAVIDSINAFD